MTGLASLKNFKHRKCKKLLVKWGWSSINRSGSHETFVKVIDGKYHTAQLIWSGKQCYPKNVKRMIEKTDIPEEEWINNCK